MRLLSTFCIIHFLKFTRLPPPELRGNDFANEFHITRVSNYNSSKSVLYRPAPYYFQKPALMFTHYRKKIIACGHSLEADIILDLSLFYVSLLTICPCAVFPIVHSL